ncbi:MAG TPA: restriction endonuclease subunit S, partial [Candidatus Paceibacterota bacterium]|nr:restriction endonuclease subunit S [Candidatus Paceibacterota bacterium]
QGAKTSILYFEKGQPTDYVWYYKIENDGFSMGTNRKPIEGSQIPELLEIFKELKQGRKPKDTKYSFCISKEQIETLDPRIAERIKKEVSEKTQEKNAKKCEKIVADLDTKLKSEKISKEMYDDKLWQFYNIVEGKIDNEIAKAIEKAHSYHFNLLNYRSNLSDEQIKDWQEALKDVKPKNGSKIEKKYQELQKTEPKIALQILASFDPKDALQMDIAREYLSKLDKKVLEQDEKLTKLFEILKETRMFEFESLSSFLTDLSEGRKIELEDDKIYCDPTISTKTNTISVSNEALGADLKVKNRILLKPGDLVIGKMHTQNGSFAIADQEYVSTGTFVPFQLDDTKINPKYLFISLKPAFSKLGIEDATGRETYKTDEILTLKIPFPPLEVQNEIVEKIEKQKQIIEGAERIEESFQISFPSIVDTVKLKDITESIGTGSTPSRSNPDYFNGTINWILTTEVNETELSVSEEKLTEKAIKDYGLKVYPPNTILLAMYGQGQTRGRTAITKIPAAITQNCAGIIIDTSKAEPYFVWYYLRSIYKLIRGQDYSGGGVPHLNLEIVKNIMISLPSLEAQRQIVEKIERQLQALDGVRHLKFEAEKRIEETLSEVWGK